MRSVSVRGNEEDEDDEGDEDGIGRRRFFKRVKMACHFCRSESSFSLSTLPCEELLPQI